MDDAAADAALQQPQQPQQPQQRLVKRRLRDFPVILGRALSALQGADAVDADAALDYDAIVRQGVAALAAFLPTGSTPDHGATSEPSTLSSAARPRRNSAGSARGAAGVEDEPAATFERCVHLPQQVNDDIDRLVEAMGSRNGEKYTMAVIAIVGGLLRSYAAQQDVAPAVAPAGGAAAAMPPTPVPRALAASLAAAVPSPATAIGTPPTQSTGHAVTAASIAAQAEKESEVLGEVALSSEPRALVDGLQRVVREAANKWFNTVAGHVELSGALEDILDRPILAREVPGPLQPLFDLLVGLFPAKDPRGGTRSVDWRPECAKRLMYCVVAAHCPPGKMGMCALQIANTMHFMRERVTHNTLTILHGYHLCLLPHQLPVLATALKDINPGMTMRRLKRCACVSVLHQAEFVPQPMCAYLTLCVWQCERVGLPRTSCVQNEARGSAGPGTVSWRRGRRVC